MRAAVLVDEGTLELTERPAPAAPGPGHVLVEVDGCGVCGTDLKILSRPPAHPAAVGIVLGHEITGTVREIGRGGPVTSLPEPAAGDGRSPPLEAGDRVVIDPVVSCGVCAYCRRGHENHCLHQTAYGVFTDGGLAPLLVVQARSCHPIDDRVPAHVAALGEPLATVLNGMSKARPLPGDVAVVLGGGPVGLMWTALLERAGAHVIAVEPASVRRDLAGRLGAATVVDPRRDDPAETLPGELGADLVVDAVGSLLDVALRLVRRRGRVVVFGMDSTARPVVPQIEVAEREVEIVGSFVGKGFYPRAVRILEGRRPDLEPLVSAVVKLDGLPKALDALRVQEAVKVVVTPGAAPPVSRGTHVP